MFTNLVIPDLTDETNTMSLLGEKNYVWQHHLPVLEEQLTISLDTS